MHPISIILLVAFCTAVQYVSADMPVIMAMPGDTVELYLGKHPKYTRSTGPVQHIFRICNGKNAKTCGYWENKKTKKKVANAAKTTRKNGVYLVLKNVTVKDSGAYFTEDSYVRMDVMQIMGKK